MDDVASGETDSGEIPAFETDGGHSEPVESLAVSEEAPQVDDTEEPALPGAEESGEPASPKPSCRCVIQ